MMKVTMHSILLAICVFGFMGNIFSQDTVPLPLKTVYGFSVNTIDGENISLDSYKGKVLLIVNVASECGHTPQYTGIEQLYQRYKDKGLVVLGFPSNDFGAQEPGTNADIKTFCSSKFNVTFPLFSKVKVRGEGAIPLYEFLTDIEKNGVNADPVKWNFQKFLIGRDGVVIRSFASTVKPENADLKKEIEAALGK